jgi:deazaflavin-dependent oxidoreductase (nitroreductase family)
MWLPLWFRHGFMKAADVGAKGAYRISGGLIGERQGKFHMLLLESTGRKSGKTRTHALLYFRDGDRYIVIASNFAGPKHPAWYWNIREDSHIKIQVGPKHLYVNATEAEGAERERIWAKAVAEYSNYAVYQQNTDRRIPVIVLTPESGGARVMAARAKEGAATHD